DRQRGRSAGHAVSGSGLEREPFPRGGGAGIRRQYVRDGTPATAAQLRGVSSALARGDAEAAPTPRGRATGSPIAASARRLLRVVQNQVHLGTLRTASR